LQRRDAEFGASARDVSVARQNLAERLKYLTLTSHAQVNASDYRELGCYKSRMSKWRFAGEWLGAVKPTIAPGTFFLDGANPWKFRWGPLNEPCIAVLDPQDRSQWHHTRVYEIKKEGVAQKFAVGYFANSWRFYIPTQDACEAVDARLVRHEG